MKSHRVALRVDEDAYAILDLERGASDAEVRAAWRRAARETHPDAGGDAVAFRTARKAYETLVDPALRAAHDRLLDARGATDDPVSEPEDFPQWHRIVSIPCWLLIAANVSLVLRAIEMLRGGRAESPWADALLFPLPESGVRVWVVLMNLLGIPWVFLILAALAAALLVTELVHERLAGTPLLDPRQQRNVRLLQAALPAPFALGLALAALALALHLVIGLLVAGLLVVGLWFAFVVLMER